MKEIWNSRERIEKEKKMSIFGIVIFMFVMHLYEYISIIFLNKHESQTIECPKQKSKIVLDVYYREYP
jgi:hypothetical protein